MDFLNQATAQIGNLFRSMSAGSRIVAGLLLVVIVVSLAYLFNHQWSGPDSYLMGGEPIAPEEINNITGVLGQAGLTNFVVEGGRIRVPRGQEATYTAALLDKGALPGSYGSYLQKALSEGGTFGSKARQGQLYKVALQMELARIIRKMSGISNAVVLYDVQEGRGIRPENRYSASVSVATTGGIPLDETRVAAIRNLVAPAIGMEPSGVVVTDLTTSASYPATKPGEDGVGLQSQYVQNKIQYDRIWTKNIRDRLSYIPGVIVMCNVVLDNKVEHELQKSVHDPKTVNVAVEEESKTLSSKAPQPSGPPGFAQQGGVPPNQPAVARAASGGANSDEESSKTVIHSVTSQNLEHTRTAGLTPSRVSASIGIPSSYLEQVWLQRNKPLAGETAKTPPSTDLKSLADEITKQVQVEIATIIPPPDEAASNPIKQVNVSIFDSLPTEELPELGFVDYATTWLGTHWSTLGTGILGLVSLVMLRSMVRAAPSADRLPAPITQVDEADETFESEPGTPREGRVAAKSSAAARLKRREKGGPSLREELVEIVREDPDAAANVLRSWINSNA